MDDVCAVCMDDLASRPTAQMPGCSHRLHVICMINCAQYDARCPVCRSVGEGVILRPPPVQVSAAATTVHIDFDDLEEDLREAQEAMARQWRRYTARRRRVLRQRPYLSDRIAKLKQLREDMTHEYDAANRAYDRRCRDAWRTDPEVKQHRDALARLRRRERRLEQQLEAELEELLGPEPP